MGRHALTEDQVRDKVLAYCARYGVSPGPAGLPPFPSGKRETRQHREWLTVYRAHQRSRQRAAAPRSSAPESTAAPAPVAPTAGASRCPVCGLVVGAQEAVRFEAGARGPRSSARLHPECASLARLAEKAGTEAVARLSEWLWPRRRGRAAAP